MYHTLKHKAGPTEYTHELSAEESIVAILAWDSTDWYNISEVSLDGHDINQKTWRGVMLIVGIDLPDIRAEWEQTETIDYGEHKPYVRPGRMGDSEGSQRVKAGAYKP